MLQREMQWAYIEDGRGRFSSRYFVCRILVFLLRQMLNSNRVRGFLCTYAPRTPRESFSASFDSSLPRTGQYYGNTGTGWHNDRQDAYLYRVARREFQLIMPMFDDDILRFDTLVATVAFTDPASNDINYRVSVKEWKIKAIRAQFIITIIIYPIALIIAQNHGMVYYIFYVYFYLMIVIMHLLQQYQKW